MLAAGYTLAGVAHLMRPEPFVAITPDWVPRPLDVILITGVLEIAGAVALLVPRTRKLAGAALALYAVCVLPANVKHAIEGIALPPVPDSWWYHAPRLAFQPVLVWAALFCAGLVDWPARRGSGPAPHPPGKTSR
ncbi:DoxX family protein [Rhodoplanes sp. TEM]|uniref:DoxX family protein n=1 Tax=Rhodoplanes tepidamans TaxID=200616 RepID=A0ABT5JIC0_RHOTP|nr:MULTISPECIES: DoxX family protein [Rhodoplanes]MDC7789342.1 DoxX family protein [Rhodoplanes tepidamans]MDC7986031.1 DoxX family protein [Rhodoplanes sp. TEM]